MIGCGLYFYSFHLACWAGRQASDFGIPDWLQMAAIYPMTAGMILAHWQVGLRRWRRGWLLPVGVATVNTLAAMIGYLLKWSTF